MTTTAAATSASPSTSNNGYPNQKPSSPPKPSSLQDDNGVVPINYRKTTINNEEPQPPPNASQQQQSLSNPSPSQQPPPTTPPLSQQQQQQQVNTEQKRPMNAFLLFCKSRRSQVKEKYSSLDNRNITKLLGESWLKLSKSEKTIYTELARQHKEAFIKANPDFKWCKTPMSSSSNNNSTNNSLNNNSNGCYATINRNSDLSPTAHTVSRQIHSSKAVIHQSNGSNSSNTSSTTLTNARTGTTTNNRQLQQQNEAPKPPKKRFLEKNSFVTYLTKNSSYSNDSGNIINSNSSNHSTNNEPILQQVKDHFPPMKFHDQDIYDKVIEDAFKETKADEGPKAISKYPVKCSTNLTALSVTQLGVIQNSSYSPTSSTTLSTLSYSSNSTGDEQPVDFSMNRTITHTRQEIIDELVEQMLSGPTDINPNNTSKSNSTDSDADVAFTSVILSRITLVNSLQTSLHKICAPLEPEKIAPIMKNLIVKTMKKYDNNPSEDGGVR